MSTISILLLTIGSVLMAIGLYVDRSERLSHKSDR